MKVLLVDDSPTILTVYADLLEKHGYEVLSAATTKEAMQVAIEQQPQIGIIDYYMPDGNGDELVRQLHQHPNTQGIICAMFSQHPNVVSKALEAGAIELIGKDDPFELFILRVNAMQRMLSTWDLQREMSDMVLSSSSHENEAFRVLFVDDSSTVREVYHNLLSKQGYEVILAEDKHSALKSAQQFRPQLAILDYYLPDGTGVQLARELRQLEGVEEPLILIYTSRQESNELEESGLGVLYKEDSDEMLIHRLDSIRRYLLAEGHLIHASRLTALGEMSSMIAHEINQPMMIISTVLERIRRLSNAPDFTPEQLQKPLDNASNAVIKADEIIRHMRSYSYQDDEVPGNHWIKPVPIIENTLKFFYTICQQKEIELHVELNPEKNNELDIWGEERQLEQLATNLINNAVRAIEERCKLEPGHTGKIRLRFQYMDHPTLTIQDNGIGMSEEQRLRCMEPFYTTRNLGEGSGLGLFIAKGITRRFQASLTFESQPHYGTTGIVKFNTQ